MIAGIAAIVAVLTAAVFLIRAGGDPADAATWPITWELRSSDNGSLFQFLQDAAAGRPLDWRFSPQVYVFPELPLSLIAYLVAGGSVYGYYLVVAALANALLFLALVALVRCLFPSDAAGTSVVRAALATVPLLALPLIGTTWILSFHLAPTYYLGMYAALIVAPVLVLARTRGTRIAVGVALALTAASNPLALLFAAPGTAVALVLLVLRRGWRAAVRPGALIGGLLLGTLVLRLAMVPLQGTSPFTYVDPQVFAGRLSAIAPYYTYQMRDAAAAVIIPLGIALSVVCFAAAVVAAAFWLRRKGDPVRRLLAVVVLGTIPLGGLAATYLMMITHYYYFWPVLVLPYVLVLLAVPRIAAPAVLAAGAAGLVIIALVTGLTGNLGTVDRYFGYRTDETRCLDDAVPGQLGYATFSDARRVALPSATGVRLIQVVADGTPGNWLANLATPRNEAGTFFYLNGHGDEQQIDEAGLVSRFGPPDREVSCSAAQRVLIYDDPAKLARIAEYYRGTDAHPR
jgi:hypothetical protein